HAYSMVGSQHAGHSLWAEAHVDADAQLSTAAYLILGGGGISAGYGLRLLVRVLSAVPVPQPFGSAEAGELRVAHQTGPVTSFVASHYYAVDFAVTLVLGFLALFALMRGADPPAIASAWPHAITLGASLGLLTNSELITRLHQ